MRRSSVSLLLELVATILVTTMLSACGGVVLSSERLSTRTDDPSFLNYGLPRAKVLVTVKVDKDGILTASIPDKLTYVRDADPNFNYRLVQHQEWYTNDSIAVQTDGAGLLSAINATSENQAVAIANQGLTLAGQMVRAFRTEAQACTRIANSSISYILDPFEVSGDGSLDRLNQLLTKRPFCARFEIRPLEIASNALPSCEKCAQSGNGVYYRTLRSFAFAVSTEPNTIINCPTQTEPNRICDVPVNRASMILSVPDVTHSYYMPLERKWLVKFDVELTFDRGVLTKFKSSNPSQALAALQLPVDVIKNILGLSTALSGSAASKDK